MNFNGGKVLSVFAALVAVAAVSTSIWLDPPSDNRARALDVERLEGLELTQDAIKKYFHINHALPADLTALDIESNQAILTSWHDPETHQPLEYQIIGETSYRLCAWFARESDWQNSGRYSSKKHTAGRDCFQYNATMPER